MDTTTERTHRTRRTLLGVPVFVWVLVTAAVAAAAVFVVWLNVNGQVNLGDGIDVTFVADSAVATVGTDGPGAPVGTCTVTNTADSITLQSDGLVAYDYCEVTVSVINAGPLDARFQRWDNTLTEEQFAWTIEDVDGSNYCGQLIPSDGTPTTVGFRFQVQETAAAGFSHDFAADESDGLMFVRDDLWDAGGCW